MSQELINVDPGTDQETEDDTKVEALTLDEVAAAGTAKDIVEAFCAYGVVSEEMVATVHRHPGIRRRAAYALSARGKSMSSISVAFRVSATQISTDIRKWAQAAQTYGLVDIETERSKAIGRLDALLEKFMGQALEGDVKSADLVLTLEKRRSMLLGLDKPLKMKIDHTHQVNKPVERLDPEDYARRMAKFILLLQKKQARLSPALQNYYMENAESIHALEGEILGEKPPVVKVLADSGFSAQADTSPAQKPPEEPQKPA
jgi:hypothetical protein